MKVILTEEVKTLGKVGAVVEVAEGYARNFLLPRNFAVEASAGAIAVLQQKKKAADRKEALALSEAKDLADLLSQTKLTVKAKAGGNGKLFGAVTNSDVADAIHHALSTSVDKHKIEIKASIKAVGSYPVEIKLHKGVVAQATLSVIAA